MEIEIEIAIEPSGNASRGPRRAPSALGPLPSLSNEVTNDTDPDTDPDFDPDFDAPASIRRRHAI
jgi:hypothetical protein